MVPHRLFLQRGRRWRNPSMSTPGDEIALTCDGVNLQTQGLALYQVVSGAFVNLTTNDAWEVGPGFHWACCR